MPLRVVVMGSTEFVLPSLERLIAAPDCEVVGVYTRPPAARGRGQQLRPTILHERALAAEIPVETPTRLRDPDSIARLADLRPDLIVTGAYGLILPKAVLDIPRLACVNLHASLLPRWRGAAPIERAIMAGDLTTGVCLFRMEPGLDTGPVYARAEWPIGDETTAGDLHRDLAILAADLLLPTVGKISDGTAEPEPQSEMGITYAEKLSRDDGRLDFTRPAEDLARLVRALQPRPGAFVVRAGGRIQVHEAHVVQASGGRPGTVVATPLTVACATGALALDVLQRPGKKPLAAAELVRGWPIPVGTGFDPA